MVKTFFKRTAAAVCAAAILLSSQYADFSVLHGEVHAEDTTTTSRTEETTASTAATSEATSATTTTTATTQVSKHNVSFEIILNDTGEAVSVENYILNEILSLTKSQNQIYIDGTSMVVTYDTKIEIKDKSFDKLFDFGNTKIRLTKIAIGEDEYTTDNNNKRIRRDTDVKLYFDTYLRAPDNYSGGIAIVSINRTKLFKYNEQYYVKKGGKIGIVITPLIADEWEIETKEKEIEYKEVLNFSETAPPNSRYAQLKYGDTIIAQFKMVTYTVLFTVTSNGSYTVDSNVAPVEPQGQINPGTSVFFKWLDSNNPIFWVHASGGYNVVGDSVKVYDGENEVSNIHFDNDMISGLNAEKGKTYTIKLKLRGNTITVDDGEKSDESNINKSLTKNFEIFKKDDNGTIIKILDSIIIDENGIESSYNVSDDIWASIIKGNSVYTASLGEEPFNIEEDKVKNGCYKIRLIYKDCIGNTIAADNIVKNCDKIDDNKYVFKNAGARTILSVGVEDEYHLQYSLYPNPEITLDRINDGEVLASDDFRECMKISGIFSLTSKNNIIIQPIYIYYDTDKPTFQTVIPDEYNMGWSKAQKFSFKIEADDHKIYDDHTFPTSISKITIDGNVFELSGNAWKLATASTSDTAWSAKDISIKTLGSDESKQYFEVTLSSSESIEKSVSVSITDKYGNTSAAKATGVKIDNEPPLLSSVEILNVNKTNNNVNYANGECKFIFNIFDKYSGYQSSQLKLYDKDGVEQKSIEGPQHVDGNRIEFTVNNTNNKLCRLEVSVTDNAGNTKVYTPSLSEDELDGKDYWLLIETGKPEVGITLPKKIVPNIGSEDENLWKVNPADKVYYGNLDFEEALRIEFEISDPSQDGDYAGVDKESTEAYLNIPLDIRNPLESLQSLKLNDPPEPLEIFEAETSGDEVAKYYILLTKDQIKETQSKNENIITIYAKDNSGNEYVKSINFLVDTTAPVIESVGIKESESTADRFLKFLTFGIFSNDNINLVITYTDKKKDNDDVENPRGSYAYSGCKYIQIKTKDDEYELVEANWWEKTFIELPKNSQNEKDKNFDDTILIKVFDSAGNVSEEYEGVMCNGKLIKKVVIEKTPPEITLECSGSDFKDTSGKEWYKNDISFTVDAVDVNSGLGEINITANGEKIDYSRLDSVSIDGCTITKANSKDDANLKINGQLLKVIPADGSFDRVLLNTVVKFIIDNSYVKKDGSVVISANATDNSGNSKKVNEDIVVYRDNTKPVINKFEFVSIGKTESEGALVEKSEKYGYIFKSDTQVIIHAEDKNASSGIKNIDYTLYDANGTLVRQGSCLRENGVFSFIVNADFKGQIYAVANDNVGNISDKYNPDMTILESEVKNQQEAHILFNPADTMYFDADGRRLYSGDTDVKIYAVDTYSGIKSIAWSVVSAQDTAANQSGMVYLDNNRNFVSDPSGWTQTAFEKNIVTEMQKVIRITNNSNDIVLRVTVTDNAGNEATDEIHLSIDKTIPQIAVNYDNNTPDATFTDFYNANRTATIVITERNFKPQDVVVNITNTDSAVPQISAWTTAVNTTNPDLTTHTATLLYSADGDYTFDIDYTDNAGNKAADFAPQAFTIDKTLPIISVAYNESKNLNHYNASRTATITINEHNFETSRISIVGTASDSGAVRAFPAASAWTSTGNVHRATIVFESDAKYSFDVSYTDKAGNKAAALQTQTFFIDKTAPVLEIGGVKDQSANKDAEIIPIVSYSDINIDMNSAKITLEGANTGAYDIKGTAAATANGQIFTFENLKDHDDVYTLTASVNDFAGNTTKRSIRFSVNRHGSVYELGDYVKSLNDDYMKTIEEDIIISEYNVDKLNELNIEVLHDGNPIDDVEYTITPENLKNAVQGDDGWYKYKYVISKDNFSSDGVYRIIVTSKDAAGNKPESTNYEDSEILFRIDNVKPELTNVIGLEKSIINAKTGLVSFEVFDAMGLKSIEVLIDEQSVLFEDKFGDIINYVGEFEIPEGINQSVKILLTDLAGNITDTSASDFKSEFKMNDEITVSTNFFVRWYSNTFVFWLSIAVIALFLGIIIVLIVRKIKKNRR